MVAQFRGTMNEEPNVKLPEPPEGMKWEYRGKEWVSGKPTTFCYDSPVFGVYEAKNSQALGNTGDYWEAVPGVTWQDTHITDLQLNIAELRRENAELRVEKIQRDVQIPLLVERKKHFADRCEYLEAAIQMSENQRDAAYEEIESLRAWKETHGIVARKIGLIAIVAELGLPENAELDELLPKIRALKDRIAYLESMKDGFRGLSSEMRRKLNEIQTTLNK